MLATTRATPPPPLGGDARRSPPARNVASQYRVTDPGITSDVETEAIGEVINTVFNTDVACPPKEGEMLALMQ